MKIKHGFTREEIRAMERRIGHSIPRPCSQIMAEDFRVMSDEAKARGEAVQLMAMATWFWEEGGAGRLESEA